MASWLSSIICMFLVEVIKTKSPLHILISSKQNFVEIPLENSVWDLTDKGYKENGADSRPAFVIGSFAPLLENS